MMERERLIFCVHLLLGSSVASGARAAGGPEGMPAARRVLQRVLGFVEDGAERNLWLSSVTLF